VAVLPKRAEGYDNDTLAIGSDDGTNRATGATASITALETAGGYGIVDLSGAYRVSYLSGPGATTVRRGFAFDRGTGALPVRDRLSLSEAAPVRWFMHTHRTPTVGDDPREATLSGPVESDVDLRARILAPRERRSG